MPDQLMLDCIVTNSPMGEMVEIRQQAANAESIHLATHPGGFALPEQSTINPYRSITDEVRVFFEQVMDDEEVIVVETAIKTYDSMIMTSLREQRTKDSGDAYKFSAGFRKATIVDVERATVRVAVPSAAKKKKRGHKPGKKVPLTPEEFAAAIKKRDHTRALMEQRRWVKKNRPQDLADYDEHVRTNTGLALEGADSGAGE
jgi:hypothetical protein